MHFVLCYPKLASADHEAIEAFRRVHEPARAKLVPAHLTLVFGATSVTAETLARHCTVVAAANAPFDFAFTGMEVEAHENSDHNLFLKVGDGRDQLVALYQAFYAGAISRERRDDIDFTPHMTIATNADLKAIITCAVDAKPLSGIKGRIESLDVATLASGVLHPIATVALGK